MKPAIEMIQIGASGILFQICDGDRFGIVEFEEGDRRNQLEQMSQEHVVAFLAKWLVDHGALTGSQHPPYLKWAQVEAAVPASRAGGEAPAGDEDDCCTTPAVPRQPSLAAEVR